MKKSNNKKQAVLTFAALIIILLTGCKEEEPKIDQSIIAQEQFEENLGSYPSKKILFLQEVIPMCNEENCTFGQLTLKKGETITYKKDNELYTGTLTARTIYALYKDKKTYLPEGIPVIRHGSAPLKTFKAEFRLKTRTWNYKEYIPILKKYPTTIREYYSDGTLGGLVKDEDDYLDIIDLGQQYIMYDVIPYAIVWEKQEPWLLGKDLQLWNERPE